MAQPPKTEAPSPNTARNKAQDEAFIREVDEAVRSDIAITFWQRYGLGLIGAIIVTVLAYGGWLYYQSNRAEAAGAQGAELLAAMAASENPALAETAGPKLAKLAKEGKPAQRAAALLAQGNAAMRDGDSKAAAEAFAKLARDGEAPDALRALGTLRQTIAEMDSLAPDAIISRLKPLTAAEAPYRATALELSALAQTRAGRPAEAQALWAKIAELKDAPDSLKSRAAQMASMLTGEAAPKAAPKAAPAATEGTNK